MVCATVGVILLLAFVTFRSGSVQREVETTRRLVRQQGFKTDLEEFNLSTSPETQNRVAPLMGNMSLTRKMLAEHLDLMAPVGSNTALVMWRLEKLPSLSGEDGWPALRESLEESRSEIDSAVQAALSGPIAFDLKAGLGSSMLLRHLAGLRTISQCLGFRVLSSLQDQNKDAAWTNLLATTRLVTAWSPEPVMTSHLVRFICVEQAFRATWETLQAHAWSDEQLAELQREWEGVDFFKGLDGIQAFSRASTIAACQLDRKQPVSSGFSLKQLIQSPRQALNNLRWSWRQWRYLRRGTYEDERDLLLFYRDREVLMQQAVHAASWTEMRQIPGITNAIPFQSHASFPVRWQSVLNLQQLSMAFAMQGRGLLERAAEAEARRRVIITAIALERFRGKHGAYPKTLADLSPDLLVKPLPDFMNGQPLRYQLAGDGNFLLYSVGLDCVDNGGALTQPISAKERYPSLPRWPLGLRRYNGTVLGGSGWKGGTDLVWPLPASAAEVKAVQEREEREEQERKTAEAAQAEAEDNAVESNRVAIVKKFLSEWQAFSNSAATLRKQAKEPTYEGKPLNQLLRNDTYWGTNRPNFYEMLGLKQVITGDESGKATFELPLKYEAVTNLGEVNLIVDGMTDTTGTDDPDSGQTLQRATNGNCLLIWDTTTAPPGQHVVQARFAPDREGALNPVTGPVLPYFSSNLCQFVPRFNHYEQNGATLYAKLVESNAIYSIEIKSLTGTPLRTITGRTTNGIINEHWDLTDERGKKYTNNIFDVSYDITLPDSGRRQRIK